MSDDDFCLTHGYDFMVKKPHDAVARCSQCEQLDLIEELECRVDGLESDLDALIEVAMSRVAGEADVESMGDWLRMNYRHHPHVRRWFGDPA